MENEKDMGNVEVNNNVVSNDTNMESNESTTNVDTNINTNVNSEVSDTNINNTLVDDKKNKKKKEKVKKEKKDNQDDGPLPSKGKIIFAWIMLVVLLSSVGGLIYIKNFSDIGSDNDKNTTSDTYEISEAIVSELQKISDNFNTLASSDTTNKFSSSLDNYTMTINYTSGEDEVTNSITYTYIPATFSLSTSNDIDEDINDKIFKILIKASLQRLVDNGNIESIGEDTDTIIDDILNGTVVNSFTKVVDEQITYSFKITDSLVVNTSDTTITEENTASEETVSEGPTEDSSVTTED